MKNGWRAGEAWRVVGLMVDRLCASGGGTDGAHVGLVRGSLAAEVVPRSDLRPEAATRRGQEDVFLPTKEMGSALDKMLPFCH